MLILYHGTSRVFLNDIQARGLNHPYLTSELDLATYYAEVVAEDVGGEPIILEVQVPEQALRIDFNALAEPVTFGAYKGRLSLLEEEVEQLYETLEQEHPEWNDEGTFRLPSQAYWVSLESVASCRAETVIAYSDIQLLDEVKFQL